MVEESFVLVQPGVEQKSQIPGRAGEGKNDITDQSFWPFHKCFTKHIGMETSYNLVKPTKLLIQGDARLGLRRQMRPIVLSTEVL